ncbi:GtrA family protein [Rhizobium sp. LCM 4573]|uniref:GtrA family protein n=1 Tax=Rhizobium sp. LCM 4573 TaxID=1848291 RepID=UPI0008D8E999|nr:GtrA family protein [Rhizobium sp. LCM 4573]OHV77111.1 hypothetical protein LCM4573_10095 [Rhizobium sp. LCM 4573]
MSSILRADFIKYFVVALVGLGVDISLAWALTTFARLTLVIASIFGFMAGALVNYFLHEFWTFAVSEAHVSPKRGFLYILVVLITLLVRLTSVVALEATVFQESSQALQTLMIAVGFSFFISYLLSKYVVFRRPTVPFVQDSE